MIVADKVILEYWHRYSSFKPMNFLTGQKVRPDTQRVYGAVHDIYDHHLLNIGLGPENECMAFGAYLRRASMNLGYADHKSAQQIGENLGHLIRGMTVKDAPELTWELTQAARIALETGFLATRRRYDDTFRWMAHGWKRSEETGLESDVIQRKFEDCKLKFVTAVAEWQSTHVVDNVTVNAPRFHQTDVRYGWDGRLVVTMAGFDCERIEYKEFDMGDQDDDEKLAG